MADKSVRYAPEFKRQMVDLVRSGRTPTAFSKEFGPTAWTISLWLKQDARDVGKGDGGLRSAEREELSRLRRENRSSRKSGRYLQMCARTREDLWLTGKIAAIHRRSHETYGSPNIHAELTDEHGIRIGRKRVARLMRAAGLRGA